MASINRERAVRIAKAHACERCGEYSYKKVSVKRASQKLRESLGVAWSAEKICGVCETPHELGINDEGDIVFVT